MRQTLSKGMVAAAAATSILSLYGGSALADSHEDGTARNSPGAVSANTHGNDRSHEASSGEDEPGHGGSPSGGEESGYGDSVSGGEDEPGHGGSPSGEDEPGYGDSVSGGEDEPGHGGSPSGEDEPGYGDSV
ncbi:hypothetical protein AB0J81_03820, partial [Streptomyces bobili]